MKASGPAPEDRAPALASVVGAAPPPVQTLPEDEPRTKQRTPVRASLGAVVGRLAAANFALVFLSVITGPLQARALGPTGRGELAAIAVPAALIPIFFSFGLGTYATFATARDRDRGLLLGTIGGIYLVLGVGVAIGGVPLAHYLGDGHEVVTVFLVIAFAAAPLTLVGLLLLDVTIGAQEWDPVVRSRFATALLASVPIPILYALGHLTVTSAAIVTLVPVVALVFPLTAVIRWRPRLRWSPIVARDGTRYGVRAWVGGLTNVTNARLDQLLMIRAVSAADLGRYAVAVNLSAFFITPLTTALLTSTSPRIARGETELVPRCSRLVIAAVAAVALFTAALSPLALRYLFGPGFSRALPATLVLLAASLPLALSGVFGSAVASVGKPGIAARAEIIGVLITVPGLILVLGPYGIFGAACVSFVAYSATCLYLIVRAHREFGGRLRDYLVPRPSELAELVSRSARWAKTRVRRRTSAAS